jgi:DedD protein
MGLFSFFQRKKTQASETRKRTPPPQDPITVEALRTRARRRLIGAAVLVGGAVVGLPTLFDKPARPPEQAFSVRMAAPDGSATVSVKGNDSARPVEVLPPVAVQSVPSSGVSGSTVALGTAGAAAGLGMLPGTGKKPPADEAIITEPKSDPKADATARVERLAREKASADRLKAEKAREAQKAREVERVREAEKVRLARDARKAKEAQAAKDALVAREEADVRRKAREARIAKDAKDAKEAKAAKVAKVAKVGKTDSEGDKPRRYVIQAGSFADAQSARDLGRRIGKLGLDSHEQRVETAAGSARTRVRLGPFNSKAEALRAAARLKAAGLNAAVLPL